MKFTPYIYPCELFPVSNIFLSINSSLDIVITMTASKIIWRLNCEIVENSRNQEFDSGSQ